MKYEYWFAKIQGINLRKKNPPASMHENSRSDLLYRRNTVEKNGVLE